MGLDVALGILILFAAIRGWIQGFMFQTIRIASSIGCVYLAAPVRERARPYVAPYLPSIPTEWVDRILWWGSAAVTYVLLVGFSTLAIRMARGPETPGAPPSGRQDQFAGFFVGMAKGALVAAFLVAGVQWLAANQFLKADWAARQIEGSTAIRWGERYQPAEKIWASAPVQHFVQRFPSMGLPVPAGPDAPHDADAEPSPPNTDKNSVARRKGAAQREKLVDSELERAVDDIRSALEGGPSGQPAAPQLQLQHAPSRSRQPR